MPLFRASPLFRDTSTRNAESSPIPAPAEGCCNGITCPGNLQVQITGIISYMFMTCVHGGITSGWQLGDTGWYFIILWLLVILYWYHMCMTVDYLYIYIHTYMYLYVHDTWWSLAVCVCICVLVSQSWYLLFELQHVFLFWPAPTPSGFNLSMTTVCMCVFGSVIMILVVWITACFFVLTCPHLSRFQF